MHSITISFPTLGELQAAVARLMGNLTSGAVQTSNSAASTPTATVAPAAAPETKAESTGSDFFGGEAEAPKPLDFDTDVINALRDWSKKPGIDGTKMGALLKKHGVAKVPELKAKGEDVWRQVLKDIGA